jgi:hypothetical protein
MNYLKIFGLATLVLGLFISYKYHFDYSGLILCCEDEEEVRKAAIHNLQEGSVEFNNIKVTGLKAVADSLGQPVAFSAGVAGIVKLLKTSNLPLTSKIALTLGVGAGSLATFSLTRTGMRILDSAGNKEIIAEVSDISVKSSGGSSSSAGPIASMLENNEQLLYEHVNTLFILQLIMVYLLVQLLIFLVMKEISSHAYTFESVKSWPQGEKLQ